MDDRPAAEQPQESVSLATRDEKHPIKVGERGLAFESAAEIYALSRALVRGGVTPKGMSEGGCMAAILKGRALGLDEVTAVTNISVVNGRVQLSGTLILALMRRAGIEYEITWNGSLDTRSATITAGYPGRKTKSRTFSMEDAKRAQLLGNRTETYKTYPDQMLLWRAVANLARQEFPEVGAGLYVPGEVPEPEPEAKPEVRAPEPHSDPLLDAVLKPEPF